MSVRPAWPASTISFSSGRGICAGFRSLPGLTRQSIPLALQLAERTAWMPGQSSRDEGVGPLSTSINADRDLPDIVRDQALEKSNTATT